MQHTYLTTIGGYKIYENGKWGEDAPMLVEINGVLVESDFQYELPTVEEVLEFVKDNDVF